MRIKLFTALFFAVAPVVAVSAQDLTVNGQTYSYVAKREANGAVRLTGAVAKSGEAFDLTVRNRHVDGTMNGTPVAFTVSKDTVAALDAEVNGATQTAAIN